MGFKARKDVFTTILIWGMIVLFSIIALILNITETIDVQGIEKKF